MKGMENYTLVLTIVVFFILTGLFAFLICIIIKSTKKLIIAGVEDSEIKEEYLPNRLLFLDHKIVKWSFYVIVACYTLVMGVLDAGQFIYVTF